MSLLAGIEWILFDAVGTLIHPDPPVAEVYYEAGRRYGSQLSVDEIQRRFASALVVHAGAAEPTNEDRERQRWRRIVACVIDDVDDLESLFEQLWRHFAEPRHWRLDSDVPQTLAALRRHFRLGIASNFDLRLRAIVSGMSALAPCEAVFCSSELGFTKPHSRFFEAIEQRLRVPPNAIALVGDDVVADAQGASSAGWRAILLGRQAPSTVPGNIRSLLDLVAFA